MVLKRKYPRTYHLPFSPGVTSDDKIHKDISFFEGKEIVVTEKMDGENTTMMNDSIYARSVDSVHHESRDFIKGMWGKIKHEIPTDWKICGENLYATHSLHYKNLSTYFYVFSIWDENDICLSVDDTLIFCEFLGLEYVPILWRGKYNEEFIRNFKVNTEIQEGFVVRIADSFKFEDFEKSIAKYVRKGHVVTDDHWMFKKVVPNELKPKI
jgi:ATP-dependent RNA circularization protein (DNA/RNA ligase family)